MDFCSIFEEQLSRKRSLYILAGRMDRHLFDEAFKDLDSLENGRSARPIRLMVSLLILKHIRNLSDESADTTLQEKNITFPTDDKLQRNIIRR